MANDATQEISYPRPKGFEGALALASQNPTVPKFTAEVSTQAGPSGIRSIRNLDMTPLAMAEVMTMVVMGLIAWRLMTNKKRISVIVRGETSWIPEDTFENHMAFERRFGKSGS